MKIPISIDPCPIIEAIVEIRMNAKIPGDAIFGLIYNEFKKDYPEIEKLPILQIPEHIRSADPNLKDKPCYKLLGEKTFIQVGPKVLSIVNVEQYLGWKTYSEKIYDLFKRAFNLFEIKEVERIAVRYVNLFVEMNIFKNSNLHLSLSGADFSDNEINITANVKSKNCSHRLAMVNHAEAVINKNVFRGSLIDIDTVLKEFPVNLHEDIGVFKECIETAHIEEKELFFSLIDKDLLQSLNPKY